MFAKLDATPFHAKKKKIIQTLEIKEEMYLIYENKGERSPTEKSTCSTPSHGLPAAEGLLLVQFLPFLHDIRSSHARGNVGPPICMEHSALGIHDSQSWNAPHLTVLLQLLNQRAREGHGQVGAVFGEIALHLTFVLIAADEDDLQRRAGLLRFLVELLEPRSEASAGRAPVRREIDGDHLPVQRVSLHFGAILINKSGVQEKRHFVGFVAVVSCYA